MCLRKHFIFSFKWSMYLSQKAQGFSILEPCPDMFTETRMLLTLQNRQKTPYETWAEQRRTSEPMRCNHFIPSDARTHESCSIFTKRGINQMQMQSFSFREKKDFMERRSNGYFVFWKFGSREYMRFLPLYHCLTGARQGIRRSCLDLSWQVGTPRYNASTTQFTI
jgi:hypothetical protein